MSEDIKQTLGEAAEVFDQLPDFLKGKVVGYAEAVQAMSRDQPEQEQKTA